MPTRASRPTAISCWRLKADREIVLAALTAVNQDKDALDYASELLQKDQELRKIVGKDVVMFHSQLPGRSHMLMPLILPTRW